MRFCSTMGRTSRVIGNVHIEKDCRIGENCEIGHGTFIGGMSTVEDGCIIGNGCTIVNAHIGKNCVIRPGARVGLDGFGFVPPKTNSVEHRAGGFL